MAALENLKHERFAHEYVIDYNMTKAAIRAGYSEKSASTQACKMLKKGNILARVKELQCEQVERLCITADLVMLRLMGVVDKSMQAEPVMRFDFATKTMVETGEYTFDSRGANRALELLGKHVGMFSGNQQQADNGILPALLSYFQKNGRASD